MEVVIASPVRNELKLESHVALLRLMADALGDEAAARRVLGASLRQAGRTSLPDAPAALLAFVRAHLVELLTSRLGPRVVAAFLDKLASAVIAAEIQAVSRSLTPLPGDEPSNRFVRDSGFGSNAPADPPIRDSAPRMAAAKRSDPKAIDSNPPRAVASRGAFGAPVMSQPIGRPTPAPPRAEGRDVDSAAPRISKFGAAPPPLAAPQPPEPERQSGGFDPLRSAATASSPPRVPAGQLRLNVLVIDADRYGRATLSRAFVQAGCDVTVIESASDVTGTSGRFHVLVANLASPDVLKTLGTLMVRYPDIPSIGRSRDDSMIVQHRLQTAGLRSVHVVDSALPVGMLLDQIRRLVNR